MTYFWLDVEVKADRLNGTSEIEEEEGSFNERNTYDFQVDVSIREGDDTLQLNGDAQNIEPNAKSRQSGSERESDEGEGRNVIVPNEAWIKVEDVAEGDYEEEGLSEGGPENETDIGADGGIDAAYSTEEDRPQLTYELQAVYPPRRDTSASDCDDSNYSPTEKEIASEEDSDVTTRAKGQGPSGGKTKKTKRRKRPPPDKGRAPFVCEICDGMVFEDGKSLRKHNKAHTKDTFDCDFCSKTFRFVSHLAMHRRVHTKEKPFKCEVCQKGFAQFNYLKEHSKTHTKEKPFRCSICQQSFSRKTYLKTHVKIHTGQKPYHCEQCDKTFTQKSNLVHHLRIHEGIKPFACDSCPARFTQKANLVHHQNKHVGQRPFKCEECDRGFYQKSHLLDHNKIHTNERPYKCGICERSFAIKSNFNNHRKVHTGERPFKCEVCEKTFSQRSNFNKHKQTHG